MCLLEEVPVPSGDVRMPFVRFLTGKRRLKTDHCASSRKMYVFAVANWAVSLPQDSLNRTRESTHDWPDTAKDKADTCARLRTRKQLITVSSISECLR